MLAQMAKDIISANYASLFIQISSTRHSVSGKFLSLKTVLFLPWAQQDAGDLVLLTAILLLYGEDHAANLYFQCFE